MKKILAILLACAMFLPALASCGTMQAGELDVTAYDAEGNYVQSVAFDSSEVTGFDDSEVTGYQSVVGRNPNYLTSIDTTGGEYHEANTDWVANTYPAQEVNATGTFDTYTGRTSGTWVTKTFTQWWGVDGEFSAATASKNINGTGVTEVIDGKEYYVFEINTAEQLAGFFRMLNYPDALATGDTINETVANAFDTDPTKKPRYDFSNAYIKLTRDIVLTNMDNMVYTTDGSSYFNGVFDGQGHVVSSRVATSSSGSGASLFGGLVNATIKDVAFVDITLTDTSRKGASGLAKWCAGDVVIDNVYFQGAIVGGSGNTGGLVGTVYDSISITNTTVDIEIGKDTHATGSTIGGLVGYANTASVTINNCKVACDMNVDGAITVSTKIYDKNDDGVADKKNEKDMYIATFSCSTQYGGLIATCTVGADQTANIQNCEISGSIIAAGSRISGAIARLNLSDATASATISNIGSNVDLAVGNVTAYPVVPDDRVFCDKEGKLYGATTEDQYKNQVITQMGGVIGVKEGAGSFTLSNCTNTGDLFGTNIVGGIVGQISGNNADATIQNCINTGNVTLMGDRSAGILANYGGNAGSDLLVKDCKNEGNVTATMPYTNVGMFCGGIGGYWNGSKTAPIGSTTVSNCFSTGDITANRASGGLIGYFQHVKVITVEDCGVVADMKFTYDSTSNPHFGGLIGLLAEDGTATINNCTVAGYMSVNNKKTAGVVYAGGLIGALRNNPTNGYFNSTNIPELGVGETYSNYTVTNCVVNLDFSKEKTEDTLEVILGLNQSEAYENDLTVNISNVRYIAVDSAASTENTEVGTVLTKTAHRTIKNIGKQKKQNNDGSYSLRYVFGVKGLSEFDVAMGFKVNVQFAGEAARTVTVYCPTLYTSIMSDTTEFTATAAGVDYLFTLVIDNVPEAQVVVEGDTVYIKNGQIDITPFTSVGESAGNRNGSMVSVSQPVANRITLTQNEFKTAIPNAFADATGLIPEVNYHSDLVDDGDQKDLGCYTVSQASGTGVVFKDTCANEDPNHHCAFTANGIYGLRDGTARYHYYADLENYEVLFAETLDVYDAYYTVSFYVDANATYDFCFQLRLKDGTQRSLLIALDDAEFDDQIILTYTKLSDYKQVITSNGSGDATYRDSYITPFSLELEAGWHTLTFRTPYNYNGVGTSNIHVRDIFMVKAS